jgi:hypothetical protein
MSLENSAIPIWRFPPSMAYCTDGAQENAAGVNGGAFRWNSFWDGYVSRNFLHCRKKNRASQLRLEGSQRYKLRWRLHGTRKHTRLRAASGCSITAYVLVHCHLPQGNQYSRSRLSQSPVPIPSSPAENEAIPRWQGKAVRP